MAICQGSMDRIPLWVEVALELKGPFQLLNSVALALVVEFQTQERVQGGLFVFPFSFTTQ